MTQAQHEEENERKILSRLAKSADHANDSLIASHPDSDLRVNTAGWRPDLFKDNLETWT